MPEPTILDWQRASTESLERSLARREARARRMFPRGAQAFCIVLACALAGGIAWFFLAASSWAVS